MAFRQLRNRHKCWLAFCDQHRPLLANAGLPDAIARSENRFRDLLRDGAAFGQGVGLSLAELPTERWVGLTQFVAVYFQECESFAPLELFPAYRREAERRHARTEGEPDFASR